MKIGLTSTCIDSYSPYSKLAREKLNLEKVFKYVLLSHHLLSCYTAKLNTIVEKISFLEDKRIFLLLLFRTYHSI